MQETLATLARTRRLSALDPHIVPLEEIYRHVGVEEFKEIEREFLPRAVSDTRAVVIAAGSGKSLLPLTQDRPKCMLDIKGRTVLERQLETLRACGISEIAVVRGYRKETVVAPGARLYDNDAYEETGELASLFAAEPELQGRFVFLYSDVLFERAVLEKVLRAPGDIVIAVDRAWVDQRDRLLPLAKPVDLVVTSDPPRASHRALGDEAVDRLLRIGQRVPPDAAGGEFIGLAAFSARGAELLRETYGRARAAGAAPFHEAESVRQAAFTDALQALVDADHPVTCVSTYKGWLEIDTFDDYQRAWAEIRS
jgi:phosphoenolpyruvate phosphomutase